MGEREYGEWAATTNPLVGTLPQLRLQHQQMRISLCSKGEILAS